MRITETQALLAQVGKLLLTVSQQGTSPGQLLKLNESGLLVDLLRANVDAIDRTKFRDMCGLPPLSVTLSGKVGSPLTFQEILVIGKYSFRHDLVTPEHFDIQLVWGWGPKEVFFFTPPREMSTEEVKAEIVHGIHGHPLNLFELLLLGIAVPAQRQQGHFACLQRPKTGERSFPCIFSSSQGRRLGIHGTDVWDTHFQFPYTKQKGGLGIFAD